MIPLLCVLLLFFGVTLGLAWPLTARLPLTPTEKIGATAALSLVGVFLFSWGVYVFALPAVTLWVLPALAALGLLAARRSLGATLRDTGARDVLIAQLLVTAWCLGWLLLVVSYSGGGWAADWFEHWERTQFFLERRAADFRFLGRYALTARPPLANVVNAFFLQLTRVDFAHYQIVSTVLGSLAFLPAALLARRFGGGPRAVAGLAVLLMLNPLFVQNATFAWTKLPAAFFVLTALYFFLRAHDDDAPSPAAALFSASLAAALLTHYSSGPYAVVLGLGWLILGWNRRGDPAWWRVTAISAAIGAAVLATWFGWALLAYGGGGTFFSNSSVTALEGERGSAFVKILLNLRDTLVPHFGRTLDESLISQTNAGGRWRDWWFQLYQLNLFFALGSIAWLVAAITLLRDWRSAPVRARRFWAAFVASLIFLGVAVHGARDTWGLTHICLQPLVILGLSFLASRWSQMSRGWRTAVMAGAALDLMAGIVLQYSVENQAPAFWLGGAAAGNLLTDYNGGAAMNYAAKLQHHVQFLNDVLTPAPVLVLALLGGLLIFGLTLARVSNRPAK